MSAGARLLRGGALLLTLMLPPLGVISFVNPFVAGAALLPGLGLLAFSILTLCAFAPSRSTWPLWATGFSLLCAFACDSHQPAEAPAEWAGVSTRLGRPASSPTASYDRALQLTRAAERTAAELVLFPEGVGGRLTQSSVALYQAEAVELGQLHLVGALRQERGQRVNGLALFGDAEPGFWPQRFPAPLGMWAPWNKEHVRAEPFGAAARELRGQRTAMLMCFEQLVSWPALQVALLGAELVLAPANLWFARGTPLNAVREVTLQSWGALMNWSVVEAINE